MLLRNSRKRPARKGQPPNPLGYTGLVPITLPVGYCPEPAMTNENYPGDWEYRRQNVLRRDKYECQACGMSDEEAEEEYGCGLHAHHIHAIADGGGHELDNLLSLCQECHVRVHSQVEETPYEPLYVRSCDNCDNPFIAGRGFEGEHCCGLCWARDRAKGALNQVHADDTICSTCFARVDYDDDTCPNCGNWELNESRRELVSVEELDIEYLLMYTLHNEEIRTERKE